MVGFLTGCTRQEFWVAVYSGRDRDVLALSNTDFMTVSLKGFLVQLLCFVSDLYSTGSTLIPTRVIVKACGVLMTHML